VVKAAIRATARLDSARVLEELGRVLAHPSWDVRQATCEVLAERGGPRAEALLRERRAVEAEPLIRRAIDDALARIARR
jgi:HEAT repeat protein